jgi:hypothetical protein
MTKFSTLVQVVLPSCHNNSLIVFLPQSYVCHLLVVCETPSVWPLGHSLFVSSGNTGTSMYYYTNNYNCIKLQLQFSRCSLILYTH